MSSPHVDKLRIYLRALHESYGVGTQPFLMALEADLRTVMREFGMQAGTAAMTLGGAMAQQGVNQAVAVGLEWLTKKLTGADPAAPGAIKRRR